MEGKRPNRRREGEVYWGRRGPRKGEGGTRGGEVGAKGGRGVPGKERAKGEWADY